MGFLKSLGVDLFYKNHPSGRKVEEAYYLGHGFSIIDASRCAEKVIAEDNFGIAVSYVSSSLFNLKSQYQDAIRCIALSSETLNSKRIDYNENTFDKAYELFRKVDAEVVEVWLFASAQYLGKIHFWYLILSTKVVTCYVA